MGTACHGAAVITLDAKGRIAIPTRHRSALLDSGETLVLTAHPDGCVLIYPIVEWEPVRKQVRHPDDATHGPQHPACLYRGTQVVDGAGSLMVCGVGDAT